jgi:hypothetical protein
MVMGSMKGAAKRAGKAHHSIHAEDNQQQERFEICSFCSLHFDS